MLCATHCFQSIYLCPYQCFLGWAPNGESLDGQGHQPKAIQVSFATAHTSTKLSALLNNVCLQLPFCQTAVVTSKGRTLGRYSRDQNDYMCDTCGNIC